MAGTRAAPPDMAFHDLVYRPPVPLGTAWADAPPPWRYQMIVARPPTGGTVVLVADRPDNLGEGLDALARTLAGEVVRRYCGEWPRLWIEDHPERPIADRFRVIEFRPSLDGGRAPSDWRPIDHEAIVRLIGGPFLSTTEAEALARDWLLFGTLGTPPDPGWDWQARDAHHPDRLEPAGLLDDPVRIWRWRLEYALRRWRRAAAAHEADLDSGGSWAAHERAIRAAGPTLRSVETVEDLVTHYFCHRLDNTWLDRPGDTVWAPLTLGADRWRGLLES